MALETDKTSVKQKPSENQTKNETNKNSTSSAPNTNESTNVNSKKKVNGGNNKKTKNQPKSEQQLTNGHIQNGHKEGGSDSDSGIVANNDTEKSGNTDEKTESNEELLEILQDVGFTVQILSPGVEPLSIQVSSMELVQEIHQLLMDREDTCHRTCFSLQLDGVTLDNFAELKNIEGLKEGSVIKVVEEPYTMREARIHVRHVRDLLKSLDPADAYNGVDCSSLSFLHTITQGDILEKKKSRPDSVDCTPPEFIMPGAKERPIQPLQPTLKSQKGPTALKVLTTSAWNPPPGPRKLHGDLMYLYVVTMEDKRYHISACPRGFYINQSTDDVFNPKPDNPSHLCHSLIDLLSQVSPTFRRSFSQMQKKRTQRHPFERVATPYQIYTWAAPPLEHTLDAIRAEDTFSSKLGYEEHIPGQTRDWNEELQTTRELPRKTLPERLLRERAIFKVHSDFVTAATRGAMAVVDGNVMAINPGEDAKMQMFIWNNIFFSLGFDVRDHYKDLGGDAAAFVAPRNDLHGVRVYSAIDIEGLYTLGTVVIDYRGYRVTAQSIIPGILEREQEQSVVYGSIDFGKTVLSHPKYLELLNKAGSHLKILPHSVLNDKDEKIELCSSVECKGIIGNDGRHYILDLLRTFPPDVNFLELEGESRSEASKSKGFPIIHKHKLSCLRQELLEAFIEDRYMMFIRHAAFSLQKYNETKKNQNQESTEKDGEKKELETIDENKEKESNNNLDVEKKLEKDDKKNSEIEKKIMETIAGDSQHAADSKEIVKKSCHVVGSLKECEFEIKFNPDVFSPGIRHVENEGQCNSIERQKQLIKDAADFLLVHQIPMLVQDLSDHSSAPMEGATLVETMHTRGINVRYLGVVAKTLEERKELKYLHTIAVSELISRAAKHIFAVYMQNTDMMTMATAISHFLNCFITSGPLAPPPPGIEELLKTNKRRYNKRTNKGGNGNKSNNDSSKDNKSITNGDLGQNWTSLTHRTLWQQIKKELKSYWNFDFNCDSIEQAVDKFKIQKISLLRSFCLKNGLQIQLREYNFESKNKPTFNEEDIINVFPVVKHINPRASDAYNFYSTGQTKIQQGYFKDGYELISEALNLLNNVYGAMHPENSQCLRMLARLSYIMGDAQEALAIQQRAVLMSERVNGIDHQYTITEYAHLALYCFANGQITTALKLLYRARYLATIVCGETHPEIALMDSNIALILHAVSEYELALRFLEHALELNIVFYGKKSLKVALSYHLVARTQSCMGDFRSALNNEKETYGIYKQLFGEKHEKTLESSECLRHLTQQAVVMQKKMNDIYSNNKLTLPPIHIQPPSMGSVLDMLNAINGIIFVQISPKDIFNLKNEIERRAKEGEPNTESESTENATTETTNDSATTSNTQAVEQQATSTS
uniref:Clustered mitochondria protein homolog n=1 Tax=Culicoides sonorensis TaxID=179676 RepID=A0A336MJK7_CULSO